MAPALPSDIRSADSLELAAEKLGHFLGLPDAAPLEATRRALDEPRYALALMASRKMPEVRNRLLETGLPAGGGTSGAAVVGKAARGILKWGADGLRMAEPWVIQKRLAACEACELNVPAPDTLVYRGARVAVGPGARICDSCKCLIKTKVALSTEHCPERDRDDAEMSRWGEPFVAPEEHPAGPW